MPISYSVGNYRFYLNSAPYNIAMLVLGRAYIAFTRIDKVNFDLLGQVSARAGGENSVIQSGLTSYHSVEFS